MHFAIGRPTALAEHLPGLVDDRLAHPARLGHGVDPGNQATGGATETIRVSGADLVLRRCRKAFGAVDLDPVRALLLEFDLAEIADHIRQQVGPWIADFVQQLFAHAQGRDQTSGAFGLGDDELAVGADLDHGEADVLVVRHLLPIGEVAAGALCATLDDVPGQCGLGQVVVVVPRPAELMHQRCADHRAVHHPAGDDDVCAQAQGFDNAGSAEVGVGRYADGRQGRCAEHLAHATGGQLLELRLQVITQQHGDLQGYAGLIAGALQGGGTGQWIDPPGVANHPDALFGDLPEQRAEDLDEVAGVAGLGIFHTCPGEQ